MHVRSLVSALLGLTAPLASQTTVGIKSATSAAAPHPAAAAAVDPGTKLLGGGAFLDWRANGSLLDNTRPQANLTGWEVSGKDTSSPIPRESPRMPCSSTIPTTCIRS